MGKRFVSLSGISNSTQLRGINEICKNNPFHFPIVIGYQVSNKSINKGTQNPRQPRFQDLGNLDRETRGYGFISAVHYYTKDNNTIIGDLEQIIKSGLDSSRALLQFNTLPPSLEILKRTKGMGFGIILKVAVSNKQSSQGGYAIWKGSGVQDVERGDVNPLLEQIYERKDFIDYIMFDPSHGTNLELNLNKESLAIRFGNKINSEEPLNHLGLIYAGGINSQNVRNILHSLNTFFPNKVSIDVESGIRTNDELDLGLVERYLSSVAETFDDRTPQ